MKSSKKRKVSRAITDRRAPIDRRILDLGPGFPGLDRRVNFHDRRQGWEDRYGWERTSRWSSSPLFSATP